jgi:hypothetical protein
MDAARVEACCARIEDSEYREDGPPSKPPPSLSPASARPRSAVAGYKLLVRAMVTIFKGLLGAVLRQMRVGLAQHLQAQAVAALKREHTGARYQTGLRGIQNVMRRLAQGTTATCLDTWWAHIVEETGVLRKLKESEGWLPASSPRSRMASAGIRLAEVKNNKHMRGRHSTGHGGSPMDTLSKGDTSKGTSKGLASAAELQQSTVLKRALQNGW